MLISVRILRSPTNLQRATCQRLSGKGAATRQVVSIQLVSRARPHAGGEPHRTRFSLHVYV